MIINDFNIFSTHLCPSKADTVLIIHSNTMLSTATALQQFEMISRRYPQLVELFYKINLLQLSHCGR